MKKFIGNHSSPIKLTFNQTNGTKSHVIKSIYPLLGTDDEDFLNYRMYHIVHHNKTIEIINDQYYGDFIIISPTIIKISIDAHNYDIIILKNESAKNANILPKPDIIIDYNYIHMRRSYFLLIDFKNVYMI